MRGLSAAAISASALFTWAVGGKPASGISMLDWPDANQTSPTMTSWSVSPSPRPSPTVSA